MHRISSILLAAAVIVLNFVPTTPAPAAYAATSTAVAILEQLRVSPDSTATYDRASFLHWIDADSNGCSTRYEVLIAESVTPVTIGSDCSLSGGSWYSYFDDATWTDPADVDIDHMVPLAEAWRSGAATWTGEQRQAFANDLDFGPALVAVTDNINQSKGDRDPSLWLPPAAGSHCQYATEWVLVKYRWQLTIDSAELATLTDLLSGSCGEEAVVPPTIVGPTSIDVPGAAPTAIGTGAVSVKGPSSELISGVTVEIRLLTCQGPAVWHATTSDRPDANGAFGIGLAPGEYCVTTLAVPAPYSLPADVIFTMEERPSNWVTVWVPGPIPKAVVTGALVAKNASGTPINGVTAHIREGSCEVSGQGVWQSTTAANRWAQGGFGISLSEGSHCVTTLAVPSGYDIPPPFEVNVASPSPYWLTVWVSGPGPWTPPPVVPYYKNCDAVRAAGAAPILIGQPGYGTHLDRDGDGIGCE